jgi:predicted XRE-type DNA-binding protein
MKIKQKLPNDVNILVMMRKRGMKLQEIADVYGVSRERVRQKIGNTGSFFNFVLDRIVAEKDLANLSLSGKMRTAAYKILGHVRIGRTKTNSSIFKGENAENLVSRKLSELGIKHALAKRGYYCDIILDNGKTIDVKSTSKKRPSHPSFRGAGNYYSFKGISKEKKRFADFFIFVIIDAQVFFIVPFEKVIGFERVIFSFPKIHSNGKTKVSWQEYQDRFDLLK